MAYRSYGLPAAGWRAVLEEGVDEARAMEHYLFPPQADSAFGGKHTRAESPSAVRLGGADKRPDEGTASQDPAAGERQAPQTCDKQPLTENPGEWR